VVVSQKRSTFAGKPANYRTRGRYAISDKRNVFILSHHVQGISTNQTFRHPGAEDCNACSFASTHHEALVTCHL